MCIFAVLLVNKYLSSSELELILINIKRNNNYYYTIKTSFIHIYDIKFGARAQFIYGYWKNACAQFILKLCRALGNCRGEIIFVAT